MTSPAPTTQMPEAEQILATWQPSLERMQHDWDRLRNDLASTRIKVVLIGNAVVLLMMGASYVSGLTGVLQQLIDALGALLICCSLVFLAVKMIHYKLRDVEPPVFSITPDGIWEIAPEEPEVFVAWDRVRWMRLQYDEDVPHFRRLDFELRDGPEWMHESSVYKLPLPPRVEDDPAAPVHEATVLAAMHRALDARGIVCRNHASGATALVPRETAAG